MIPRSLKDFFPQLQVATENSEISWHEADSSSYFCDHKNFSLHISVNYDPDRDAYSYGFRIAIDNRPTHFNVSEYESDYYQMKTLYEAIAINANKVPQSLKNFFS